MIISRAPARAPRTRKTTTGTFAVSLKLCILIVLDQGSVVGTDGKLAKLDTIDWTRPQTRLVSKQAMEDMTPYPFTAYVRPYMLSLFPPGTVPVSEDGNSSSFMLQTSQQSTIPAPVMQIVSSITKLPVQTLPYPFPQPNSTLSSNASFTLRLLTTSPSARAPLFFVSTLLDRTHASAEGSCIWRFQMKSWGEQINELVRKGSYSDALALLDVLDYTLLPDKVVRDHFNYCITSLAVFDFRMSGGLKYGP